MQDEPPNLENIVKEVGTDGYFARARQRAKRRKSLWNVLLIPLCAGGIAGFTFILARLMWRVHTLIYPEHAGRFDEFWRDGVSFPAFISSFLLMIPLGLAALPLGLMFGNFIAWCIPPARRALDSEAVGIKWASYRNSMRGLSTLALIIVPVCLLLSLIGALTLRNLR